MTFCNDSKLMLDEKKNKVVPNGLPTEAALKVTVEKIGNLIQDQGFKDFKSKASKNVNKLEFYGEYL